MIKNKFLKAGNNFLIVTTLLAMISRSIAAPTGGVVTSGNADISQSGAVTNINQSTHKASINWNSFSIADHETVNFNQPGVNSITLNRVIGNEASIINGALNANGQVWILNSNGVLFGKTAQINTSGLLASTKTLSDSDFQNGNYQFKGDSTNSVVNLGTIDIQNSGYTVLLANSVSNDGSINAIKGQVRLVGANEVSINLNGNSLINLTIDKGVLDALVENKGAIYAEGGEIYLTTNAVNDLLKGVVNNTGIIEAQSLGDVTGKIELFAHGGEVQVGGTLKAEDGFIETSGKDFTIAENTIIQTGMWLIDPTDITIDAALASTLQTQLASGNALLTTVGAGPTAGDIGVYAPIAWSANTLTLHADNDININATLNATATAGLALEYAQTTPTGTYNISAPINLASTGSFSTKKGADAIKNYTIINTLGVAGSTTTTDLQGMNGNKTANYVLGSNIDASATTGWNAGTGFNPVGDLGTEFTGTFDGLGHTISNLFIDKVAHRVGLFGSTIGATIGNVGLIDNDITGITYTGSFVGWADNLSISNAYATGAVSGGQDTGGLAGWVQNSTITNAYTTGAVSGARDYTGGLVGAAISSTITNAYATGAVSGGRGTGGLVGGSGSTNITNAYATGAVSGTTLVGGLVGEAISSDTANSFWNTDIIGASAGGTGLTTAQMKDTKTFYDAGWDLDTIWGRDTNNVENDGYLGLRALSNFDFNTVVTATLVDQTKIYDGTSDVLATLNKANVIDSVAFTGNKDVGTYAFTSTLGDYGLTYATGFNSSNTEALIYGSGNSVITQKALTLSGITASNKVYDGTTTASTAATLSGLIAGDTVSNSIASTFNDKNVGTAKTVTVDTVTLAGTDSANYAIATGQTTTANVTQKALIPSGITANNKVYDGTTTATVNATLAGLIGGDSVSIASTFDDESIGVAKTVTLNSLAGTDGANYSAVLGQTTTADITAIPVVASTVADNTVSNIISTIFNDAAVTSNPLIQPVIPDVNTSPYGSTAVEPVDQPSKLITMSELKEANNDNSDELRTPVYEDSPLTLVNKGLHMPTGVDQQFFIPEDDDDKDER